MFYMFITYLTIMAPLFNILTIRTTPIQLKPTTKYIFLSLLLYIKYIPLIFNIFYFYW